MSDETAHAERHPLADAIGRLWWLPLLRGILLAILGVYALFRPDITIVTLAQVIGIFVVAEGLLCVLASIIGKVQSRLWLFVRGVIDILAGAFVFANPMLVAKVTGAILVYLLAFAAILSGIFEIVAAIQDRKQIKGEGWLILSGAVTVLFGVVLLLAPLAFGELMVRVLGAIAVFAGVSLVVFAFRVRRVGKALQDG